MQNQRFGPTFQEHDADGNSLRRVVGRVKYPGYFQRFDLGVPGDVLKTTPGHLFYSLTRDDWCPAETFEVGEWLRNRQGQPVPHGCVSPIRWEFCELHNIEVEEFHTYFFGGGPHGGILTHNGLPLGCRVPRAAVAEALENGAINRTGQRGKAGPCRTVNNSRNTTFFLKTGLPADGSPNEGIDADQYTIADSA